MIKAISNKKVLFKKQILLGVHLDKWTYRHYGPNYSIASLLKTAVFITFKHWMINIITLKQINTIRVRKDNNWKKILISLKVFPLLISITACQTGVHGCNG